MKPKKGQSCLDRLRETDQHPEKLSPVARLLREAALEERQQRNPQPPGQRALRRAARAAAKTPIVVREEDYLFRDDGAGNISIEQHEKLIEHPSKGLFERAINALNKAQGGSDQVETDQERAERWARGEFLPNELDPDRPMLEQLEERAANGDEQTRKMLEEEFYPNPEIMSLFHDVRIEKPDTQQAQPPEQNDHTPAEQPSEECVNGCDSSHFRNEGAGI